MSGKRLALIIASSQFEDKDLSQLIAPPQDAEALARVLADPEIGNFEVQTIINGSREDVSKAIEIFFQNRRRDDLLLFYYSGHGIKDDNGQLYFSVPNTQRTLLLSTAISAGWIHDVMERNQSSRQVLILDCCYSGAFTKGMISRADRVIGTKERFEGHGRVILTASDNMQYSFEGESVKGEGVKSVFTSSLLYGLETGDADINRDGQIDLEELYEYVHDQVREKTTKMTPRKWSDIEGRIIVARNPKSHAGGNKQLPTSSKAFFTRVYKKIRNQVRTPPYLWSIYILFIVTFLIASLGIGNGLFRPIDRNLTLTPTNYLTPAFTFSPKIIFTITPQPDSASLPQLLPAQTEYILDVPTVLVPAGPFLMGSDNGEKDEQPVHIVILDDYYIDQYEASHEHFAFFLNVRGNQSEESIKWLDSGNPLVRIHSKNGVWQVDAGYENHPAVLMTWNGAQAYCIWRGGSLPSEAQWEKAARGGLEEMEYPWGDVAPICSLEAHNGAQFNDCSGSYSYVPIGSFTANGYGLYDMAGNVWEWVMDWYDQGYYVNSLEHHPLGPNSGDYRVLRGGAWDFSSNELRVASRDKYYPSGTNDNIGFRCVYTTDSILDTQIANTISPTPSSLPLQEAETYQNTSTITPAITPSSLPSIWVDNSGVPMVLVPSGSFEMGSRSQADELPIHTVNLENYYIDQFELTNKRYLDCVNVEACEERNLPNLREPILSNHPVVNVNWSDAVTYCEWRGGRLPTEAEWEKAARGGLQGQRYIWGDEPPICQAGAINGARFDDEANCNDVGTASVGTYAANGLGIYDMAGNVWEWVSDWYADDYYSSYPDNVENPLGPNEGVFRIHRGGSWFSVLESLRVANRAFEDPAFMKDNIGFRCVIDISP